MRFLFTICKIIGTFRYFGTNHIVSGYFSSECAIKPHSYIPTKPKHPKVEKYPPTPIIWLAWPNTYIAAIHPDIPT